MAYHRFLTNNDYNCIATEEHMRQLIRDVADRIPQAEQRAEMQMLEYLDQYYEIEKVLAVGKNIRNYNHLVSYPGQVYIKVNEDVFKTLCYINGLKKPTKVEYWRQVNEFVDPRLIEKAPKYSQLGMYSKGRVVRFGTEYWQCVTPNGYDADKIHTPGINAWKEAEITPWEPNMEWEKDQVYSYNEQFYQYLGTQTNGEDEDAESQIAEDNQEDVEEPVEPGDEEPEIPEDDAVLTPEEDDCWGLIGEYDENLEYDFSEDARDYVVAEGTVFYPILNPNPDKLEEGVNITRDDPRNTNVVAHMSRIALYHLHSIISATNIPETRRWAYEDSIQWLYNASKFKINPQLPRKHEHDSCLNKVDWACETFQKDFNPHENPWLI